MLVITSKQIYQNIRLNIKYYLKYYSIHVYTKTHSPHMDGK